MPAGRAFGASSRIARLMLFADDCLAKYRTYPIDTRDNFYYRYDKQ